LKYVQFDREPRKAGYIIINDYDLAVGYNDFVLHKYFNSISKYVIYVTMMTCV